MDRGFSWQFFLIFDNSNSYLLGLATKWTAGFLLLLALFYVWQFLGEKQVGQVYITQARFVIRSVQKQWGLTRTLDFAGNSQSDDLQEESVDRLRKDVLHSIPTEEKNGLLSQMLDHPFKTWQNTVEKNRKNSPNPLPYKEELPTKKSIWIISSCPRHCFDEVECLSN